MLRKNENKLHFSWFNCLINLLLRSIYLKIKTI